MNKKVLFVATVLRGHILVFHLPYMKWFQEQGYEVHVCARNDTGEAEPGIPYCDRYLELPFERSPLHPGNFEVYQQLKKWMEEQNYALVHCHTPVGGMMGRLCARSSRKHGTKVLYTAHGFHFFSGAPLKNWLLFYPAERWLARYTDLLITINEEDYERAKRFSAKQVAWVHGVGIDLKRFEASVNKAEIRASLGVPETAFLVACVGEHSVRKNHETAIKAAAQLTNAWLLFCGVGEKEESLRMLAKELNLSERTLFLGFQKDIPALLQASDAFVFPSFQEGLPVALMEAMGAGLPCVVSDVRGNRDLVRPGEGGSLYPPSDVQGFAEALGEIMQNPAAGQEMGRRNREVIQDYGLPEVQRHMEALYGQQLSQGEAQ